MSADDTRAALDALLRAVRSQRDDAGLRRVLAPLLRRALQDPLTGLADRGRFAEALELEVARARRYQRDVAVVLIDLDHFKRLNDTHGHLAGDRALVEAARIIAGACRSSDLPSRYGGDEFAVLLPETPAPGAESFAEKIRSGLATADLPGSLGVAVRSPDAEAEALLEAADRRLYRAKAAGGDRVCAHD